MASYPTRSSAGPAATRPVGSSNRSFASVDPERQREVANPGDKTTCDTGNAHTVPAVGDSVGSSKGNDAAPGSR